MRRREPYGNRISARWNSGTIRRATRDIGPEARYLRSHVLEMPIHQGVTPSQVEYIADQVLRLRTGAGAMLTAAAKAVGGSLAAQRGTNRRRDPHLRSCGRSGTNFLKRASRLAYF